MDAFIHFGLSVPITAELHGGFLWTSHSFIMTIVIYFYFIRFYELILRNTVTHI